MSRIRKSSVDEEKQSRRSPPTNWKLIERLLECKDIRVFYLWGPPGVGKTWSAFNIGCSDRGYYSVTLTEDTPANELRGHYLLKGNEMVWADGPFTRALREGARLVINEISRGNAETWSLLLPVAESPETARLTLPTNETIQPAEGLQIVFTDNQPPDTLPDALQDRFECQMRIGEPHPSALEMLSPSIRKAMEATNDLPEGRRVSIRAWLTIERLRASLGLADASRGVFGEARGEEIYRAIRMAEMSQ